MKIKRFNEMMEDKYDYERIIKELKGRGWGFGIISSVDDFEENDQYFFNPNNDDDYAEQFHVYLTDLQTGQLRGEFNNKTSLKTGKWQHGIQVNTPVSIYNQRT